MAVAATDRRVALARLKAIGRGATQNDLYLFCKHLLGYNLLVPRIHRPMAEFFQPPRDLKGRDFRLLLEPRKTFKTTICVIGFVCWLLERNPNEKILLAGSTADEARKRLRAIRSNLEEKPLLRFFYNDLAKYAKQKTLWKQESIIVAGRTITDPEPSVDTCGRGQGGSKVGNHYTTIICDDVENATSVSSDIELVNSKELVLGLLSCMMPPAIPSIMRVVGTHWDDDDVYCMLRGRGEEYRGKFGYWQDRITSAEDDDGNPTMPEILSAEDLAIEKASLSAYEYSCNYLNDPVPKTDSHFPPQHTMWWHGRYFKKGTASYIEIDKVTCEGDEGYRWKGDPVVQLKTYILCDPALSEDKQASYSAIVVAGKQYDENRIWVLDGYRIKSLDAFVTIKMLLSLALKYDPLAIGIEDQAYQLALSSFYESEAKKQGIYTRVEPIGRNDHRSKDERIIGLSSFWKAQMVMLPAFKNVGDSENPIRALKRELWRFRVGSKATKDMADALSRINDIDVGTAVAKDLVDRIRGIERRRIRDWFTR